MCGVALYLCVDAFHVLRFVYSFIILIFYYYFDIFGFGFGCVVLIALGFNCVWFVGFPGVGFG